MILQNIINKTHSMSFAEYLYNSIQANTTFFLTSDWGLFVNIEKNDNTNNYTNNQTLVKNNIIRSLATIKENSVKSFQSMSNLHNYDNIIINQNQDTKKDIECKFWILTNTINLIKNSLYFFGAFALASIRFTFRTGHSSRV